MKRSLNLLKLVAIVFFFLLETEIILVRVSPGRTIYSAYVKDGDTLELSHINSIYGRRVREVLNLEGGHMVLSQVITDSYGVKEYYLLENSDLKRRWKILRFKNSEGRGFDLKIKNYSLELEKYPDKSFEIEIRKVCFVYGLFHVLRNFWVH